MKTEHPPTPALPPAVRSSCRPLLWRAALLAALGLAQAPLARAQSPSPSTPHAVPSSLQTQVTSLTNAASTQQQKLRAATLQWALTQAAYLFSTTTDRTDSPPTTIDPTASFYPGDTTVTPAPSGVTSGTTYDLRFSPFGLGDGLVRDVSNNLASNTQIGNPNTTKFPYGSGGYNLSPAMPSWPPGGTFTNFLAEAAGDTAGNYYEGKTTANDFDFNDGEVALVEVFTHPDYANYPTAAGKAAYGNSGLVDVVFNSIEYYNEQGCLHVAPNLKQSISGSFENSINYYLPYLLVKARYPDLILPSMQTWWEASIYRMLTFDYNYDISSADPNAPGVPPASDNGQFLGTTTESVYPNNDFRRMEGMFYASILFQNSATYPNVTANVRRGIYNYIPVINSPAVEYGDGAFTYAYHSNGLLEYQNSANTPLSNMFVVLKGSTVAADLSARGILGTMLQKCWLYYPEQWVAQYYPEDVALTPSWKEPASIESQDYEFHGHLPCFNPELACSAYPQVWRVYYEHSGFYHQDEFGTLSAAAFDPSRDPFQGNGSLAANYDPNDYFGYDQNLAGPTSRFGTWQMFGSARPEATDTRGPGSVMSFYLHDPHNNDEAALNRASAAVWTSATSETTGSSNDGIDSTIVTPIFASVVTQSSVGGTGFQQEQEWLYTPSRVVGMTTVTVPSSGALSAFAIGADVYCLYSTGVANSNTNPTYLYGPDSNGDGNYRLTINVVHNGFGYSASDTTGVRLYDSSSVGGIKAAQSYAVGDHGYSLVDIHPTPAGNATALETISTGIAGVYGLEVADANGRYRLIHNTTASAVTYSAYLPVGDWGSGSVLVHHAETPAVYTSSPTPYRAEVVGETYRPAWMNSNDRSSISPVTPTYYQLSSNNFSYSVPAYSHIVIANVPGVVDGGIYELEPRSAPGNRLDVSGAGTANGTPLDLYSRNGYINQLWQAQAQGNGVFRFLTLDSTSYLDVTNDGSANGTQVVIATDGTTPGKQWTPLLQTNGSLAFRPGSASGSLLDADSSYSPVRIDISTATYSSGQEFNLIRTNPVLGVGPVPSE